MKYFPAFATCLLQNCIQFGQLFDQATIHKEEQHATIHKEERPVMCKLVGHNAAVACGDVGKGSGVDKHRQALHHPYDHRQQHIVNEHCERAAAAKVVRWLWTKNEMSATNEW